MKNKNPLKNTEPLKTRTLKNWVKLGKNKSQPNTEMWGNEKKGGMVFISKLNYPKGENKWRFGGTTARGYFQETYLKTKPQAMAFARKHMREH